jgi:hypothetical protein
MAIIPHGITCAAAVAAILRSSRHGGISNVSAGILIQI